MIWDSQHVSLNSPFVSRIPEETIAIIKCVYQCEGVPYKCRVSLSDLNHPKYGQALSLSLSLLLFQMEGVKCVNIKKVLERGLMVWCFLVTEDREHRWGYANSTQQQRISFLCALCSSVITFHSPLQLSSFLFSLLLGFNFHFNIPWGLVFGLSIFYPYIS